QVFNTAAVAAGAATLGTFQALTPTTFSVSATGNGTGAGTFRAALTAANARVGSNDIINFSTLFNTPQQLDLTAAIGSLVINDPVTIQGPGVTNFILNGANLVRPLTITDAGVNTPTLLQSGFKNPLNVTISGMTITNGNAGAGT